MHAHLRPTWMLVGLLTFLTAVSCQDSNPIYRHYISPFSSYPLQLQSRNVFPFSNINTLEDMIRLAVTKPERPPGKVEEPEFKLNLNKHRLAITKIGFTCGVPGNGMLDPFELGAKFDLPPWNVLARISKNPDWTTVNRLKTEIEDPAMFLPQLPPRSGPEDTARFLPETVSRLRYARDIPKEDVGEIVQPNLLCWQVKIRFDLGNGTSKLCGGSIIGSRTILTAAHCLMDSRILRPFHPSLVTVQIGDESTQQCKMEIVPADLVLPHENYDLSLENNDIGLILLAREIRFSERSCACKLCVKDMEPVAGDNCIVYGTGKSIETENDDTPLRWHKQRVLKQSFDSRCAFFIGDGRITDLEKFVCASDLKGDTSCQGDEGGSFVCYDSRSNSHYAAGIVAFSAGCGKRIGSQYTKVRPYLNWIEDNTSAENVRVQRGWNREIARNL